jgi:predicted Zn-dependent protease
MHKSTSRWLLALTLAGGLLAGGCSTVPVTGRKQLTLISAGEEMQLGLASFEKMKAEVPISKDAVANALVRKVGQRIAAVAELPGAQWEFVVFDSKEANAFCLPGGKVGVYTGLLPITRDEAGLATVIGHEVAHAVARHGGERLSQEMLARTGGQVLGSALSYSDPTVQTLAGTAYSVGAQVGVLLPYSRKHESEADEIGLRYMARAGYDPEAAVGFWQRFAKYNRQSGGTSPPWFLRTHPVDEQRIEQIKRWLPQAKADYLPPK